jgi:hypothetical protein
VEVCICRDGPERKPWTFFEQLWIFGYIRCSVVVTFLSLGISF